MSDARSHINQAIRAIDQQKQLLEDITELSGDDCLLLLAELGRRHSEVRALVNKAAIEAGAPSGARERILRYLLLTQGKVVDKDEISGVAGIFEWARRIRELRVEEGWPISSSENRPELQPGQYVLEATAPDPELKERWQQANAIRRLPETPTARILKFLEAYRGSAVTGEELDYVAKTSDWESRLRVLREEGHPIKWESEGGLSPGAVMLADSD